ncbi:hypothetical protein T12_9674 [Trichinella patagoniensis]|uniref:Uncharacterized protein n=1 Tax=Trichinella patagoniensis TaxID=990121 RepID=A0A0V0ZHX6_9BILA|nr:hypothetical protein T12_9674 [Trichinella patagoniensis]
MAIDSRHELPLLAQLVVEFFMQKYAKIYSMRSESRRQLHVIVSSGASRVPNLKGVYYSGLRRPTSTD